MNQSDIAGVQAAIASRRDALLDQCPPTGPIPSPQEAARLPINVVELGTSGPTVLIVHGGIQGGLGGGPATFDKQRPLAERGWRLRMVERPGFGSSPSRGPDDMEADSEWIADMLEDGAHLVGHSWGAAEALLAAARRPGSVHSLTLIEPALFPIVLASPEFRDDPRTQAAGSRLGQLMLKSDTPADYAINFAQSVLGPEDDGDVRKRIAGLEADRALAAEVGCSLLRGRIASPQKLREAADAVSAARIPTLVVNGGWSPFFQFVGTVVAQLTNGRFETVQAANHMVQDVSATAFNDLLEAFMLSSKGGQTAP